MYSFQVARKLDGEKLHIDEYLSNAPLLAAQKRHLIGDGMILRDTHEVPIVRFSNDSETEHFRAEQLRHELQEAKDVVLAGVNV